MDLASDAGAAEAATERGVEIPGAWRERWLQSEAGFVPGRVPFLTEAFIRDACAYAGVSDEVRTVLVSAAASVAGDPALERLAWHCYWLLFRSGVDPCVRDWPPIPARTNDGAPMLYGLVFLAGVPHVRRLHASRGIDPEVTKNTLADLELWIREGRRRHGDWTFRELGWLVHHMHGHLHAVGRLQYLPRSYAHPFRFYRHRTSQRVVALAEDGLLMRQDGMFASADGGRERRGLWRTRLVVGDSQISGNELGAEGRVLDAGLALPRNDWVEILRQGDPVMTVHIPATGPMTPERCGESFAGAVDLFARCFPEAPYRAFTCHSWLLDPQFEHLDPQPANIAAFLRAWYLHPTEHAADRAAMARVFDCRGARPPVEALPQRTSLQRGIVALMKQGGGTRSGAGVFFPADLPWTAGHYRDS